MINKMNRYSIINLRKKGVSYQQIAQQLDIDRKTVSKICREYELAQNSLEGNLETDLSSDEITESVIGNQKYNSSNRNKRKLTPEIKTRIYELLEFEKIKTSDLGKRHKQKLSGTQIHRILKE